MIDQQRDYISFFGVRLRFRTIGLDFLAQTCATSRATSLTSSAG